MNKFASEFAIAISQAKDSLFLFLHGWLFPTDASINVNISQSQEIESVFPFIEVIGEDGNWVVAEKNIGFPKGKNKMMVINMTNKFFSDDYRIRLRTTMQIYWDQIFMTSSASGNLFKRYKLHPVMADLVYRGFSEIDSDKVLDPLATNANGLSSIVTVIDCFWLLITETLFGSV